MSETRRQIIHRLEQLVVQDVALTAILLISAGTLRWWNAWAYAALFPVLVAGIAIYVLPRNPDIIAARAQMHHGTKRFDHVILGLHSASFLALMVVAGLDAGRYRWTTLGWPWPLVGAVLLAVSVIPVAAAMGVNRHMETTVRIQSDRDHRVVTRGPYRLVRHPMYIGMIIQLPASALLLGSYWALVPATICIALLVVRTALEDRTLLRDLSGYASYAKITRYRLVPGLW